METKDTKCNQSMVVTVSGQLDVNSTDKFSRHCLALIGQGEKKIVLDFSQLKYLSSAGLRAILMLHRQVNTEGGSLTLCSPSEPARMVLMMSGFLEQLKVIDSLEELA
jgi:anti-sigma B factor antagonist